MKINIELDLTEKDIARLCSGEKSNFIFHLTNKKAGKHYDKEQSRLMQAVLHSLEKNNPEIIQDMKEFDEIGKWLVAMPYICLGRNGIRNRKDREEVLEINRDIVWAIESPCLGEFPLDSEKLIQKTFKKLERKAELKKKRGIEDADEECQRDKEIFKSMIERV
jgi:hypothetical protein